MYNFPPSKKSSKYGIRDGGIYIEAIMNKIKSFTREQCIGIIFISISILCIIMAPCILDADYFWAVSVGRDIIENGIPKTNTLCFYDGLPVVLQQWLYNVWLAVIDPLGLFGVWLSTAGIAFGTIVVYYKYHKLKGNNRFLALGMSSLLPVLLINCYYMSIRPETLTLLLLLIQIYLQEIAAVENRFSALLFIPILTLIEINCHASMWIMHFLIYIPYFIPAFKFICNDNKARLNVKDKKVLGIGLITAVMMAVSLFVNPYGYNMIKYTFSALGSDVFDIISVSELTPIAISKSSYFFWVWIIAMIIFCFRAAKKKLNASEMYIVAGLLSLCFIVDSLRNIQFIPIVYMLLSANILKGITLTSDRKFFIKDSIFQKLMITVTILCVSISIIGTVYLARINFSPKIIAEKRQELDLIKTFSLIENNKNVHIMSNDVHGAMLEYYGYKSMLDPRPELYNYELEEGRNPLTDSLLLIYSNSLLYWNEKQNQIQKYDIYENWLNVKDYYSIDYVFCYSSAGYGKIGAIISEHQEDFEYICGDEKTKVYRVK